VHVETSGPADAPVILLIHGGGVAGWMWRSQVAQFPSGYQVIVPDLPGHGRSADEPFTSSAAVVHELARILAQLPAGTDVTVIGFSLGAQLAIQLASDHPDVVTRVVVVSALTEAPPLSGLGHWLVGAAAPLARRRWFATIQGRSMFIPPELMDDYLQTSASISKQNLLAFVTANSAFRIPSGWATFPGPVLLLAGSAEPKVLLKGMRSLNDALPSSELEVFEGAGHGLPLQHPEWFAQRVGEWMAAERPTA
jgi:pimeloyl-ACP methyl ester carboxylesterase